MKRMIFLVVIGLVLLACTSKTKNTQNATPVIKTEKKDTTRSTHTLYESEFNEHEVNNGPVDTASFIFESWDVDQAPQFPGGEQKLLEFISKHLKYPVTAQDIDLQGQVLCHIIVSKTGKIGKCEVIRSLDRVCDNEALRVLKTLPRFIPGKLKGKNVNVWYTIPVTFKLQQ